MRVLDVSSRETTIGCEQEHLGEELGVLHRGLRIQGVGRRRIKSAQRRRAVARFDVPERANARGEWLLNNVRFEVDDGDHVHLWEFVLELAKGVGE